jgi:hypothetical protein
MPRRQHKNSQSAIFARFYGRAPQAERPPSPRAYTRRGGEAAARVRGMMTARLFIRRKMRRDARARTAAIILTRRLIAARPRRTDVIARRLIRLFDAIACRRAIISRHEDADADVARCAMPPFCDTKMPRCWLSPRRARQMPPPICLFIRPLHAIIIATDSAAISMPFFSVRCRFAAAHAVAAACRRHFAFS